MHVSALQITTWLETGQAEEALDLYIQIQRCNAALLNETAFLGFLLAAASADVLAQQYLQILPHLSDPQLRRALRSQREYLQQFPEPGEFLRNDFSMRRNTIRNHFGLLENHETFQEGYAEGLERIRRQPGGDIWLTRWEAEGGFTFEDWKRKTLEASERIEAEIIAYLKAPFQDPSADPDGFLQNLIREVNPDFQAVWEENGAFDAFFPAIELDPDAEFEAQRLAARDLIGRRTMLSLLVLLYSESSAESKNSLHRFLASARLHSVHTAAERHRRHHGEFPATLEVLVEEGYLEAGETMDPFSGEPFRLLRTPEIWRPYSVGSNFEDHGGRENNSAMDDHDLFLTSPPQGERLRP